MGSFAPDVAAYIRRVSYSGPGTPSADSLREIQRCHTLAVPFENLDVVAGLPIPLDGPSLEQKLVRGGRGGYCFEHNLYLLAVLREMGFQATPFLARVRWNVPANLTMPRAHMVLKVETDGGLRLFDVGFGGMGVSDALALDTEDAQPTRDGLRRVQRRGSGLVLQASDGGPWADVYQIDPDEAAPIDWEVANWFTSTHPQSRFRQNLIVARSLPDGRCAILNRELTVRRRDGPVERRVLESAQDLLAALREHFGLSFPPGTRFGAPGAAWPV
jgi:N-hydroxyarylamine O-acetyltransferase